MGGSVLTGILPRKRDRAISAATEELGLPLDTPVVAGAVGNSAAAIGSGAVRDGEQYGLAILVFQRRTGVVRRSVEFVAVVGASILPNHRILSRKVPGCVVKACCNPAHHRLQGPVVSTELEFCKLGHPLTGDNVVVENRNGREFKRCRTCRREAWRSWQRQKTS
jgi:hypothetical protein